MSIKDLSLTKPFYPDEYLVEEDQMGDSGASEIVLDYLKQVLRYLYRYDQWAIAGNRNHYHLAVENSENLIVPDIAVFKGIPISAKEQVEMSSWDMRKGDKPCPPLVIESSSPSTWHNDIDSDKKPQLYGLIGVQEYFAYDPNPRQVWPRKIGTRLLGWRYDAQQQPITIIPNAKGWLWSEVLESWLVADGVYLRLYDADEKPRLTADEVSYEWAKTQEQARLEAEKQIEIERQARLEAENRAKAQEERMAELERQLAELRRQSDKN